MLFKKVYYIICILFLWVNLAVAAPGLISSTVYTGTGSGSTTIYGSTPTGSLVVMGCIIGDSTSTITSMTDNNSNVYSPATNYSSTLGGNRRVRIYYSYNISGRTDLAVSWTTSTSVRSDCHMLTFSMDGFTGDPLDQVSSGTAADDCTSGSITTANNNNVLVSVLVSASGYPTSSSGFTTAQEWAWDFFDKSAYLIQATAGSASANWTTAGSNQCLAQLVSFKTVGVAPTPTPFPTIQPAACNTVWEDNMLSGGTATCADIDPANCTGDDPYGAPNCLDDVYYDGERVFYQAGDYLSNSTFTNTCTQRAKDIYVNRYVNGSGTDKCNGGACPGYWNFTTGSKIDYNTTASSSSLTAVMDLSTKAMHCQGFDTVPLGVCDADLIREYSYCLMAQQDRVYLGGSTQDYYGRLVSCLPSMVADLQDPAYDLPPFMVGIWAQALIREYEINLSPTVRTNIYNAISSMADFMWNNMLLATDGFSPGGGVYPTFEYRSITDPSPAPDLNLLYAPLYAWLYCRTGDGTNRERYDKLFCGGNNPTGYFPGGKQYNQAYMWSIRGQEYRNSVGQAACPAGTGDAGRGAVRLRGIGSW